ncbi:MAG: inositol-3-phosphate synthase [Phycisphaerae bacterium]
MPNSSTLAGSAPRIAIVGVGNCASTLVQGLSWYRRNHVQMGLMHSQIAGLSVGDIQIACAFDIDSRKISRPVAEAIFARPNNARVFCQDPDDNGAVVHAGPSADGVAAHLENFPPERRAVADKSGDQVTTADVVKILRDTRANVLVNYLPVGSQAATEFYARAALEAGIAMVNCIPVFIASDPHWAGRFARAGLPIIGDDVKSQFGATIIHRQLMALAEARGISIQSSYQLNVGGNTDFLNMLERGRLGSKKTSKTEAVNSQLHTPLDAGHIHIGPSDYIPFLNDQKICYIRINAHGFGGLPMEVDVKLAVEDSPNSAGVVVDAVRCAWLALKGGIAGALIPVSAALMKHPPEQMPDADAAAAMDEWIAANTAVSGE